MVVGGKMDWMEQKQRRKDQVNGEYNRMKIQSLCGAVRMEH